VNFDRYIEELFYDECRRHRPYWIHCHEDDYEDDYEDYYYDEYDGRICFGDGQDVIIQPSGIINGADEEGITAFTMPRNGCISKLAVSITVVSTTSIPDGTIVTITAELFKAKPNSSIFTPIPRSRVIVAPSIVTTTPQGTVFTEIVKNINYLLKEGKRLALVFTATIPAGVANTFGFRGVPSGGVTIL